MIKKGSGFKDLFYYDYILPVKKTLDIYGDVHIIRTTICRKPINELFQNIINPINNTQYDKFFHLFLIVELITGEYIKIEKNENINVELLNELKFNNKTEIKEIYGYNQIITVNKLLNKTRDKVGNEIFFNYSVINNCQSFLVMILESNNIYDIEIYKFIKQDTNTIFKNWPTIRRISNLVTRLYSNIKIIIN